MLDFSFVYDSSFEADDMNMMTDAMEARTENYRTQPTLQNHSL